MYRQFIPEKHNEPGFIARPVVEAVNSELNGDGRVLVRPSGTEPLIRVLAEAPTPEEAEALCVRIASLVTQELG